MPSSFQNSRRKKRLAKIDFFDSTAMHPTAGPVPSINVHANDTLVGTFIDVGGRFMPTRISGQPLMMTVCQMDRVNSALGLPPEINRQPRQIYMAVPEEEVVDLAIALIKAGVLP